jgi:hypothetical protein
MYQQHSKKERTMLETGTKAPDFSLPDQNGDHGIRCLGRAEDVWQMRKELDRFHPCHA